MPVIVPPSPPHITSFRHVTGSERPKQVYYSPPAQSESPSERTKMEAQFANSTLPPELIRKIISWACEVPYLAPKMCLISSAVSEWALPIIYHSLRFTTAQAITDFVAQHDKTSERIYTRLLLVRDLYIGKIPDESSDLSYGSLHWPITSLQRLISSCAELRSLTVLGLDQRLWARFQPLLPPRLTKVTLGPIHGAHNSKNLKQHPPISFLTSAHTYLSDGEVEDVMMYPTMTRFRKMCEANSMAPLWAVNQAPIIKRSKQMKEYEIVICGAPEYAEPAYVLATQRKEELELDSRVVLRQYHGETWIAMVFQEFLDCRQCFLASQ